MGETAMLTPCLIGLQGGRASSHSVEAINHVQLSFRRQKDHHSPPQDRRRPDRHPVTRLSRRRQPAQRRACPVLPGHQCLDRYSDRSVPVRGPQCTGCLCRERHHRRHQPLIASRASAQRTVRPASVRAWTQSGRTAATISWRADHGLCGRVHTGGWSAASSLRTTPITPNSRPLKRWPANHAVKGRQGERSDDRMPCGSLGHAIPAGMECANCIPRKGRCATWSSTSEPPRTEPVGRRRGCHRA